MSTSRLFFAIWPYSVNCLWVQDNPLSKGMEYNQIYAKLVGQMKSDGLAMPQMGNRLLHSTQAGAADPCGATILATIGPSQPKGIGFGARMNNFAIEILLAAYLNVSLAACESQFGDHFASQMWLPHYLNVLPVPICNDEQRCNFDRWNNRLQPWMMGRLLLSRMETSKVSNLLHFVYPYILTVNSHTQDRVEATIRELGLDGADYVGVHVRLGDKIYEKGVTPPSSHAGAIDKVDFPKGHVRHRLDISMDKSMVGSSINRTLDTLGVVPGTKVFITSDDPHAFAEIDAAIGTKYQLRSLKERGNTGTGMGRGESRPDYQDDDTSLALVTDIEILRRANIFLGTASSNLGRLVYVLRDPHLMSINLGRRSEEHKSDWIREFQSLSYLR